MLRQGVPAIFDTGHSLVCGAGVQAALESLTPAYTPCPPQAYFPYVALNKSQ